MIKITQSPLFQKQKKKLHKNGIKLLYIEIRKKASKRETGQEKRGTLKGVRVYKFHIHRQLFLLAYEFEDDVLKLIMIGGHENYYRDLKRYHNE